MRTGSLIRSTALLLAVHATAAVAQSVAAARVGVVLTVRVSTPNAALSYAEVANTDRHAIPRWPFVVVGAAVGGALAARSLARSIRATNDGDWFAPWSDVIVVGGGAVLGAIGGFLVGSVVHEASDRSPVIGGVGEMPDLSKGTPR